jgi:excinuclease ABC subunit B
MNHNTEHGIEPRGIVKEIKDITERVRAVAEESAEYRTDRADKPGVIMQMPRDELVRMIKDLESQMKTAAKNLEFEKAALLRDQIVELRRMSELDPAAAIAPAVRA